MSSRKSVRKPASIATSSLVLLFMLSSQPFVHCISFMDMASSPAAGGHASHNHHSSSHEGHQHHRQSQPQPQTADHEESEQMQAFVIAAPSSASAPQQQQMSNRMMDEDSSSSSNADSATGESEASSSSGPSSGMSPGAAAAAASLLLNLALSNTIPSTMTANGMSTMSSYPHAYRSPVPRDPCSGCGCKCGHGSMSALCQACLQRGYAGPRTPCPCSQSSNPNSMPEQMMASASASNYLPIYLNGGRSPYGSARYPSSSPYYPSSPSFARRSGISAGGAYYGHPSYAAPYGDASSMLTTMLASASEPMAHNLPFYQYVAATSSPYFTSSASHPLLVPRPLMTRRSSPLILVASPAAAAASVDPMMAAASSHAFASPAVPALKYFALPSYHQPSYALPAAGSYYSSYPQPHHNNQAAFYY